MSNKLKKDIKNVCVEITGVVSEGISIAPKQLEVIITNNSMGTTISIHDGKKMFSIPLEPIKQYLV